MEIAGARRAGNGESSEDESQPQLQPQPQPLPQPLPLWAGSCRSAVAYCRHLTLYRARRATSCWERRQLRGEVQGSSAPAKKHMARAMFTVPEEAQAQASRQTAAVEVKLSADTISGLVVPLLSSPGKQWRVPRAAGLPRARRGRAGARQVAQRPPVPQPCFVACLIIVGSFWKRGEE